MQSGSNAYKAFFIVWGLAFLLGCLACIVYSHGSSTKAPASQGCK